MDDLDDNLQGWAHQCELENEQREILERIEKHKEQDVIFCRNLAKKSVFDEAQHG